ncbi:MAG: 4Fe-4S cluster-binding domain-containing protein [Bacteroidales bacterium]|nr:MAG: 4Fe-4S cluster-binding domain-containing protein [Bacteroidales bacterium]
MKIRLPQPISLGFLLSYKCSASCKHCMYACSSKWKDDWISHEDLYKILSRMAGIIEPCPYGANSINLNYGLHFTGGEPFLNFDLLCEAVEMAEELDIPSTFVETNCFWAVNDKSTKEKLSILKNKGLKGILISVNPFFLEYVPFERTERTVKYSYELFGHNLIVYQHEYYKRFRSLNISKKMSFEDFLKLEGRTDFARNTEFFISGRAPYKIMNYNIYMKNPAKRFFKQPCNPPFIRSWHNHVDNYGNIVPGYCGGLSLGSFYNLDELTNDGIDSEEYPVLNYIISDNFEGLLSFAKERGYKESKGGYLSKCHLCVDIRKYLASKEDFKELKPEEFYQHLED